MPDLFFIWTHSIWLQMPWEWFATAKVTSQVSLCASGWFLLWLKSQNQIRNACNKYWGVYCHLQASVYIAAILGQFPSNHFETVFFPPYSRSDVGLWLMCCVCPPRQWGDRGRQCRGEGERSIPAHYWQSADAFRTVAQTGAARMNAPWCVSQRTQRKTSHICYKITVPAEAPTGL